MQQAVLQYLIREPSLAKLGTQLTILSLVLSGHTPDPQLQQLALYSTCVMLILVLLPLVVLGLLQIQLTLDVSLFQQTHHSEQSPVQMVMESTPQISIPIPMSIKL